MTAEDILKDGLKAMGIEPDRAQVGAFMLYLAELKKWGRAYSLTSLKADRDIVIKHFLDSALFLKALSADVRSVADVGSGAGFPGLPVKVLRPALEVHLIEPSQKKAAFLRNVIRRLGLKGITVVERRVEAVEGLVVDAALTRALFKAGDFAERAGHIVKEGGVFILSKGPRAGEELEGLGPECETRELALPLSGLKRTFIVIKKAAGRPAKKEREARPGAPQRTACVNPECRLRRAGCTGFPGCPGFMGRG
jgi:16S rRNA (guanine527-N7)-methyltransferase